MRNEDDPNEREWGNPNNWKGGGFFEVYSSKADNRIFVPKRRRVLGYTVNIGQRAGLFFLLGFFVCLVLLLVLSFIV